MSFGSEIILLNSPGGSTLQCGVGRGLLCLVQCVAVCLCQDLNVERSSVQKDGETFEQRVESQKSDWHAQTNEISTPSTISTVQSATVRSLDCDVDADIEYLPTVVGLCDGRLNVKSTPFRVISVGSTGMTSSGTLKLHPPQTCRVSRTLAPGNVFRLDDLTPAHHNAVRCTS